MVFISENGITVDVRGKFHPFRDQVGAFRQQNLSGVVPIYPTFPVVGLPNRYQSYRAFTVKDDCVD